MKKNKLIWVYGVGLLCFVISLLFDKEIVMFVTSLRTSLFNYIFVWITHAGSALVVLFVMTSLFLYEERKRRWILPLWLTLGSSMFIAYLLKEIVSKARPEFVLPLVDAFTAHSFPSGHTLVAFSALPLLDKEFKKLKWFWLLFAIVVGFSRVYVGVHYLSDVIAGAMIGFLIGDVVLRLEEKYKLVKRCLNLS